MPIRRSSKVLFALGVLLVVAAAVRFLLDAFAAVGIASARGLGIEPERANVNGGAIALGHPIGMSGARITLHLCSSWPAAAVAPAQSACASAAKVMHFASRCRQRPLHNDSAGGATRALPTARCPLAPRHFAVESEQTHTSAR